MLFEVRPFLGRRTSAWIIVSIQSQCQDQGGIKTVDINNPVLDNIRTGSALKGDSLHAFNDIIDNHTGDATKFSLTGGDGVERTLYQLEGSLNGKTGVFEWIVDPDPTKGVTHRRFIEGVGITGKPNARPQEEKSCMGLIYLIK